jgi:type IV pilus assembly protein PilC
MAIFAYTVKNREGKSFAGTVESPTAEQAAAVLRDRGWVVTSISLKEGPRDINYWVKKLNRVSERDKVIFTRQLATMIEAGLPLGQALEVLTRQTRNPRLREALESSIRDVEGGASLSASFAKYPEIFDRVYISLIKAGEASGSLDKILLRLADVGERRLDFSSAVKQAMVYPAIVISAMGVVFLIMIVFVLPKLTSMYKDLGVPLPLPTKIMIFISDLFVQKWWLLFLMVGAVLASFYYFLRTSFGQYRVALLTLRLPVVGKLAANSDLAQFSRTLSLLVSSGLPFLECLEIVNESLANALYRDALKEAARQVERGVNLSVPLRSNPLFPPVLSQMMVVGEETGRLDEVLLKISAFFEGEVERTLKNLTVALEPAIMILLGLLVGVLVFSIITPIYKLTSYF